MTVCGSAFWRRGWMVALAVVTVTSAIGCGSDDGGSVAGSSGGTSRLGSGSEPTFCDEARFLFQNPVDPAEMVDHEEISEAEAVDLVNEMADRAGEPDAADLRELARFVERFATDPDSRGAADSTRIAELFNRAVLWSARTCPPTTTVWGCAARSRFEAIGDTIGEPIGPDIDAGSPPPASNKPEDVAREHDDPALRRVEVVRDAARATFAWVDENGLARKTIDVVNVRGTWTYSTAADCS